MTDPGMEAVLAELMAEHVRPDEAGTGKGDPMQWRREREIVARQLAAVPKRQPFSPIAPMPDDDWCTCGVCWECTR
jgi:hypothetical protein